MIQRNKRDRTGLPSLKVTQTDPTAYKSKYKVTVSERPRFRNQLVYQMNNPKESKVPPELTGTDGIFGISAPFEPKKVDSHVQSLSMTPTSKNKLNQSYAIGEISQDEKGNFNSGKMYQLLKTQTQLSKY